MSNTDKLNELVLEFKEFKESSWELEKELELELEYAEKERKDLKGEIANWKNKYQNLVKESSKTQSVLNNKINTLKNDLSFALNKLRDIEISNDDMEQKERLTQYNLNTLSTKYDNILEKSILLESELEEKELLRIELQKTKDDLRDSLDEVQFLRSRLESLKDKDNIQKNQDTNNININHVNVDVKKDNNQTNIKNNIYNTHSTNNSINSIHTINSTHSTKSQHYQEKQIPQSKSMLKIQGILGHVRVLEDKLAVYKSSFNKPSQVPPTVQVQNIRVTSTTSNAGENSHHTIRVSPKTVPNKSETLKQSHFGRFMHNTKPKDSIKFKDKLKDSENLTLYTNTKNLSISHDSNTKHIQSLSLSSKSSKNNLQLHKQQSRRRSFLLSSGGGFFNNNNNNNSNTKHETYSNTHSVDIISFSTDSTTSSANNGVLEPFKSNTNKESNEIEILENYKMNNINNDSNNIPNNKNNKYTEDVRFSKNINKTISRTAGRRLSGIALRSE